MAEERFKSTTEMDNSVFRGLDTSGSNAFTEMGDAVSGAGLAVVNTGYQLYNNISDIVDTFKAPTDEEMKAVGDAMKDATKEYWEKKKEDFKIAWNTTEKVTIGAIVGRVCDLTWGEEKIIDNISDRLAMMVGALTGTTVDAGEDENAWLNLAENMADDFLTYVTTDKEVGEKVAEIDAVKGIVKTVKTIKQTRDNITDILEKVEPLIPYAELIWEFASAYFSGGTSLIKATSDLDKQAQTALHKLIVLALTDTKKMIFAWKLEVPSLLLSALDSLTNVEKVTDYSTGMKWLDELLNEDYYKQIKEQSKWNENLEDAIKWLNDPLRNVEGTWTNETVKKIFTNRLVVNSLGNLVATAYATTGIDEREFSSWDEVGDAIYNWYTDYMLPWLVDRMISEGVKLDPTSGKGENFRMSEMTEEEIAINSRYMLEGLI